MRAFRMLALASILAACVPAMAMTLDDLTPGKTVSGPDLTVKEMKGKVVYVVFWGTH
jgi:hypothetical protein